MTRVVMFFWVLVAIAGTLNTATGCIANLGWCNNDAHPNGDCCAGYCYQPMPSPAPGTCLCFADGLSCNTGADCCGGVCNSQGYCGCIGNLGVCTAGHNECCGGRTCQTICTIYGDCSLHTCG